MISNQAWIADDIRAQRELSVRERPMKAMSRLLLPVMAGVAMLISAANSASAQSLGAKVTGTWTLASGTETYADGKKLMPWATGSLMLDSTGHFSFFLIGKDQP